MSRTFVSSTLTIFMLCLIFSFGCSGATSIPTSPAENPIVDTPQKEAQSERMLWGIWQFSYDQATKVVVPVPLREADLHYRVNNLLLPPNCGDCINIQINSVDLLNHLLDADVTLRNPTSLTVYDARLIVYTNDLGHELLDPDDWTGLWDITGGQTINPFRAYGKLNPNREYLPAVQLTENFLVSLPDPPELNQIVFAIDASWPGNCEEPFEINNFWQEPIYDTVGAGGNIYIDVHDWQNDVSSVTVIAPDITGVSSTPLSHLSGDTWYAFLQNNAGAPVGDYKVEFVASSTNGGGVDLYDFENVTITTAPDDGTITVTGPNGGEVWEVGSSQLITWDWTGDIPYVNIAYYKDNDEGTSVVIEGGVPNTGSYNWASIPDDPSTTVKIRVADNANPGSLFDDSDNFFTIESVTPKTITVTEPGYLDVWEVWSAHLITWNSTGDIPFVNIIYYKDYDVGTAVVIEEHVPNTGSYNWGLIPDDPSGNVKIRVSDESDPGIFGDSDLFFTIVEVTGGWVNTWGGTGEDIGFGVTIDSSGYKYATGGFSGTVDFDPGPGIDSRTSNGYYDVFLVKYDGAGIFRWVRTWGGSDYDAGLDIATDGPGNVFVTGWFRNTVDFDPGLGTDNHISNGVDEAFLCKFNPDGNLQWAHTWGGISQDQGLGVVAESSGNVYVTGYFSDTVDFNPGVGIDNHLSLGLYDTFLNKFDADGNFLWARTFGGTSWEEGVDVTLGVSGEIIVTGIFNGTVGFNPSFPGDSPGTSNGGTDIFIDVFDSGGNFQWFRTWGGSNFDYASGVAAHVSSGSIYVSGYFRDTVDFDPGSGVEEHTSNGDDDVFFSKFDSSGIFQWARTWGGTGIDRGYGIAVDWSGDIYTTGYWTGTVDFDPGPVLYERDGGNAFLSKFNPSGDFQLVRLWGGNLSCWGNAVAVGSAGDAYVTGYFVGTADFDPGLGVNNQTENGGGDAFLVQIPTL